MQEMVMSQDDVIELFKKANRWDVSNFSSTLAELQKFAEAVAAKEREECAKVCDLIAINACDYRARECGVAIRARGQNV